MVLNGWYTGYWWWLFMFISGWQWLSKATSISINKKPKTSNNKKLLECTCLYGCTCARWSASLSTNLNSSKFSVPAVSKITRSTCSYYGILLINADRQFPPNSCTVWLVVCYPNLSCCVEHLPTLERTADFHQTSNRIFDFGSATPRFVGPVGSQSLSFLMFSNFRFQGSRG